jgi:hypothetical protein
MVEVFRTNVECPKRAAQIVNQLAVSMPAYQCNFDLDDCDRILRIESPSGKINCRQIIALLRSSNIEIEVLES